MNARTVPSLRTVQNLLALLFGGILCAGCSRSPSDQTSINPALEHFEKGKLTCQQTHHGEKISAPNELAQALNEFSQALTFNSRYAEAYYERGKVFAALGLYELACEDYSLAAQYRPFYPEVYLDRAQALLQLKHFSRAIPDAKEAVRQSPLLGPAYTVLGKAYFYADRPDYLEARNSLMVARQLDKNFDAENLILQTEEKLNPRK